MPAATASGQLERAGALVVDTLAVSQEAHTHVRRSRGILLKTQGLSVAEGQVLSIRRHTNLASFYVYQLRTIDVFQTQVIHERCSIYV